MCKETKPKDLQQELQPGEVLKLYLKKRLKSAQIQLHLSFEGNPRIISFHFTSLLSKTLKLAVGTGIHVQGDEYFLKYCIHSFYIQPFPFTLRFLSYSHEGYESTEDTMEQRQRSFSFTDFIIYTTWHQTAGLYRGSLTKYIHLIKPGRLLFPGTMTVFSQ